jgi:hypothetical protein
LSEASGFSDLVKRLEGDLGLPAGFFISLGAEGDWSFVIKTHALIEAALAHLIEKKLAEPDVSLYVGHLPIGGRNGKVALALALKLIDSQAARFIDQISKIRNRCVHRVLDVNLSLVAYVKDLNEQGFRELEGAISSYLVNELEWPSLGKTTRAAAIRADPKGIILFTTQVLLGFIYLTKELARLRVEMADMLQKNYDLRQKESG